MSSVIRTDECSSRRDTALTFTPSSNPADPLLALDTVIVAPHALCWTDECFRLNGDSAVTSLLDVAAGRVPRYVVNRDALAHERLRHLRAQEDR